MHPLDVVEYWLTIREREAGTYQVFAPINFDSSGGRQRSSVYRAEAFHHEREVRGKSVQRRVSRAAKRDELLGR